LEGDIGGWKPGDVIPDRIESLRIGGSSPTEVSSSE